MPGGSGEDCGSGRIWAFGRGIGKKPRSIVAICALGDGVGGRARGIPLPRRDTCDHSADDRPDTRLLIVALAIAKTGAAGLPLVALIVTAVALEVGTSRAARAAGSATTSAHRVVAVHVVTAVPVAVGVSLGPPPTTNQGTWRTGVDPVDVGAEVGPSVVTCRP